MPAPRKLCHPEWSILSRHLAAGLQAMVGTRFAESCCIAATRIVIDVLDYFGVEASPLAAQVYLYNGPMLDRLDRDGLPATQEEAQSWLKEDPALWSVGLGVGDGCSPERWPGHLVAVARFHGELWLIDGSLGQGCRPHRGIHAPAVFIAPVEESFLQGDSRAWEKSGDGWRTRVEYWPQPERRDWISSPNWKRDNTPCRKEAGRIIRAIQDALFTSSPLPATAGPASDRCSPGDRRSPL